MLTVDLLKKSQNVGDSQLSRIFSKNMYTHQLSIYTPKDIQEICRFWSNNNYFDGISPIRLKNHLLWKYNLKFTRLWIVKKQGQIIGSCGRIETRLLSHGKFICNAPWGVDSLVDARLDKKERRFVFFKVFRRANREGHRIREPEVGFCFPNEVVKSSYLRIGYLDIPIFYKFSKDVIDDRYKTSDLRFTLIKRFDPRWNRIWNAISKNFSICVQRDHAYLNWRYLQNPNKKYIVLMVKSSNRIKGYVVLREKEVLGKKVGCIVDFLAEPNEALINKITSFLSQRGCRSVEAHVSHKGYRNIFLKLGFKGQKIDFFIITPFPEFWEKLEKNYDEWFLTSGDGDFEMES